MQEPTTNLVPTCRLDNLRSTQLACCELRCRKEARNLEGVSCLDPCTYCSIQPFTLYPPASSRR